MKQRTSQILFKYWNELRGRRMAPDRFEIEPARLSSILPETFILERTAAGDCTFRLAGTRICESLGRELRGTSIFDLVLEADHGVLDELLRDVTQHGAVAVLELEAGCPAGRAVRFEAVLLPLVHLGPVVSRYLGALSPFDPPAWLGTVPLATRGLVSHSLVWPDGQLRAPSGNRQTPLLQAMMGARIVRVDRRQFRVLDGGRGGEGSPK